MDLKNVKIGCSALTNTLYLYIDDGSGLAKIKRPCEPEFMQALVTHMLEDLDDDKVYQNICLDDGWFKITVERIQAPPEDDDLES